MNRFIIIFIFSYLVSCSSSKSPFLKGQMQSYETMVQANTLLLQGEEKGALKLYERACFDFASLDDLEGVANCRLNEAMAHLRMGNFKKAASGLNSALELSEQFQLNGIKGQVFTNLAVLKIHRKDYKGAFELLNQSVIILKKYSNEPEHLYKALSYRGFVFIWFKKYPSAQKDLEKSLDTENENTRSYALINLARVYLAINDLAKARENALKALKLDRDFAKPSYIVYDYFYLAKIERNDKNPKQCIIYAKRGLNIALLRGNKKLAQNLAYLLSHVYRDQGDNKQAAYYQKVKRRIKALVKRKGK